MPPYFLISSISGLSQLAQNFQEYLSAVKKRCFTSGPFLCVWIVGQIVSLINFHICFTVSQPVVFKSCRDTLHLSSCWFKSQTWYCSSQGLRHNKKMSNFPSWSAKIGTLSNFWLNSMGPGFYPYLKAMVFLLHGQCLTLNSKSKQLSQMFWHSVSLVWITTIWTHLSCA